jgi:hypothetical protein
MAMPKLTASLTKTNCPPENSSTKQVRSRFLLRTATVSPNSVSSDVGAVSLYGCKSIRRNAVRDVCSVSIRPHMDENAGASLNGECVERHDRNAPILLARYPRQDLFTNIQHTPAKMYPLI